MSRWRGRQPRVVTLALEFLEFARGVAPRIARVQESGAGHLEDAAASQLANIGEALDEDSGGDMRRFLRYAKRSGGECERLLLGAAELGCITRLELDQGMRLLKNIRWDLVRLLNWAQRARMATPSNASASERCAPKAPDAAQPPHASVSEPDAPKARDAPPGA